MLTTQLITASDLHERYIRLAERGLFPDLIRRLIISSDPTVRWIHFRAHEGIAFGGWDGRIEEAGGAAPYVPSGASRWELGTNDDALSKLKSDFNKRNNAPEPDAHNLTLVFVVIRRRQDKEDWAREFASKSPYREVHILDCDDLETWLHQHPSIHIWLSVLLNKRVEGAQDLESSWHDWAAQTNPVMQPAWLLTGRTAAVARLTDWLADDQQVDKTYSIFASTADEARAFLSATILTLPEESRTAWLGRAVIVHSDLVWQQLIRSEKKMILIPHFHSERMGEMCAAANRQGHRALLPRPANEAKPADQIVSPLDREGIQQLLEEAGLPKLDAAEKASLARRSFTAFHRSLLVDKSLQSLWWRETSAAQLLLPLLLINRWTASTGDQQLIEHLTGQKYSAVEKQLLAWTLQPGTPVRLVNGEWFIIDPADVWEQTAPYLTPNILDRFSEVVQHVLGLPLARFGLPPDERYWANLRGMHDDYSATLRQGLTNTLALLNAQRHPSATTQHVPGWVETQVRMLLEKGLTDSTGYLLASLDYHLPALAEAAPDAFLATILRDLPRPGTVLVRLFDEEQSLTHRTAHHTGLLWALESLAWPSQYLSDAALALAGLDRLDPGGQISNRPINSLRTIFLGWRPQTNATVAERLTVLERIRHAEPEVGWRLLIQLLPNHHDVSFGTRVPSFHWREWEVNPDTGTTRADYFAFLEGLTKQVLTEVGTNSQRWSQLIDELPLLLRVLDEETRQRVLDQFGQLAAQPIPNADRQVLIKELREFINRHRSIPDADWAWGETELAPLVNLYEQLQPDSLSERYAWLFDQWPKLPEGLQHRRHRESEDVIRQRQQNALGELLATEGVAVIGQLIPQVPDTFRLGYVCGQSAHLELLEKLSLFQQFAASTDEKQARFAKGLVASLTRLLGDEHAAAIVRDHYTQWQAQQVAEWLVAMPMTTGTWQLAEELGKEAEAHFWRNAHSYVPNDEQAAEAVRHFLAHHRPAAAVSVLNMLQRHDNERLSPELVLEVLEGLSRVDNDGIRSQMQYHELETLLDELEHIPDEHRAQAIKLSFLFSFTSALRNPRLLNDELQRNPDFFVELLAALYKPDTISAQEVENLSKEERRYKLAIAERAWSIFSNWKTVPGVQADGTLDGPYLIGWVNRARQLAAERGVTKGFNIQLGLLLSHTPAGADGIWPSPAVSELLETEAQNESVLQHVHTGRYNIHGRTHAVTGGRREEKIAEEYAMWANEVRVRYPVTARLLRGLAEDFTSMAQGERQRADREEQFG